jgi:signal transduction histidine kinase
VVEGPTLIAEALSAGVAFDALFVETGALSQAQQSLAGRARRSGIRVLEVQDGVLDRVADAVTPQPMVAVVEMTTRRVPDFDLSAGPTVVCVGLQDPGNAGAVVRSAWASGASGVVFCGDSVDVYNPKAVRASAGALFWLPVVAGPSAESALDELARAGAVRLAAVPQGGRDYLEVDLTAPTALVFGSEAAGLPDPIRRHLDGPISIPMGDQTESLNVAMAATVMCFEARRQRLGSRTTPPTPSRRADAPTASEQRIELVSAVSHELRSPLTSIRGYSALLIDRWDRLDEPDKLDMIRQIHHDSGRVSRLLAELSEVSRIEAGRLDLRRDAVHLADLVDGAVRRVALQFPDLEAHVELPPDLPDVYADSDRIEQVLANLVENACKYASAKGLRIRASCYDQQVAVFVTDQGEGIPEADLPRLFDKYYRSTTARPSGTGLGLWISRALIEAHGGHLTVDSNAGQGSSFRFTLPMLESDYARPNHEHT